MTSARRANVMRSITRIGREKFIQITGNVALTGFTAPKILWVRENEPEVFCEGDDMSCCRKTISAIS